MKIFRILLLCFVSLVCCWNLSAAASSSPAGMWKTDRSIIKIYLVGNELRGDIVKVLGNKPPTCVTCTGQYKNKPLIGMTVMRGLKLQDGKWVGGTVYDPASDTTYKCEATLSDDGQVMSVYAHRSLFGRTLTWKRIQ